MGRIRKTKQSNRKITGGTHGKNAEGLADLFFRQTAEALYKQTHIEMKPLTEEQLAKTADNLREIEINHGSGAFA